MGPKKCLNDRNFEPLKNDFVGNELIHCGDKNDLCIFNTL